MSPLPSDERRALLEVARRAIRDAVEHGRRPELPERSPDLPRGGVFVTLHQGKRLRGCIGMIEMAAPLEASVAHCAVAAAMEDPRFAPVRREEIPGLTIEISLLSPPAPIEPEAVVAGRHGLIVSRGYRRGLLLPQVAPEQSWSAERFLEETCAKAGLERDAWRDPETRVEAFTAEVFSEADFRAENRARAS
jgi:AmmeMemoRadiSam system protein A